MLPKALRAVIPVSAIAVLLAAGPAFAGRDALPLEVAGKLDPGLMGIPADQVVPVWVEFTDKGETGPSDLARRLAEAEAALTPRCRARRERAHVRPLVDYLDLPLEPRYVEALRAHGFVPYGASRWFNRVAVHTAGGRLEELAALPFVRRLRPVELVRQASRPAPGPDLARLPPGAAGATNAQWVVQDYGRNFNAAFQLNVPAVHDSGYIGTGVLVCILDAGFNYYDKQEALRTVSVPYWRRRNFPDGTYTVQDTLDSGWSHGTWVMGCIAGNLPGAYLGTGYGAHFALARTEITSSETPIEMVYWGMGAEWADSLGADLISSSLGYFQFDNSADNYTYSDMDGHTTTVTRAAEIAASKGILVVDAVGNEGTSPWHYLIAPSDANGDSLIAAGAVDAGGNVASFSSYGPSADLRIKPDLAARGVSDTVVSASGDPQGYTVLSGTSFATPLLAGLAACLLQARPQWTPTQVIRALRETASRANNPDDREGYGIPDGLAALRWIPDTVGGPPIRAPGGVLDLAMLGANPLRGDGVVRIRFALGPGAPAGASARVVVLDPQGRAVRTLFHDRLVRGAWQAVTWDGRDGEGRRLAPGLYLVTFRAAGHAVTRRVISLP